MQGTASMLFTSGSPQRNAAQALVYWGKHPTYCLYEGPGARAYWVGPGSDTLGVLLYRW